VTAAAENDHEWQYNPRKSVANVDEYSRRAAELSQETRRAFNGRFDIGYGASSLSSLDVFPAERTSAPLHVFLHGGYWRGRDKSDYSYLARALVPHGVTTVILNYDLCPSATLPGIITQVRNAFRWIHAHAGELGGDPNRMTASGHSAGAHLIAMALAANTEQPVPGDLLQGAVLISGIYELTPVLDISVNKEIRLKPEQVRPTSPRHNLPGDRVPLDIVVGGSETPAWVQQSRDFARACEEHGTAARYREFPGHNHYSIMTLMEEPDGPLTQLVAERIGVNRT
jgi:arylformamidase